MSAGERGKELFKGIREKMRLPVMAAPMFLVSGPEMASACAESGIACGLPSLNAREPEILDQWLSSIDLQSGLIMPNLIVHRSNKRSQSDLDLVVKHKAPIVISALGHPGPVVEAVHSYGGMVFSDVNSMALARKAANANVDGLVLVCAGAGGHTGALSPFSFIPAVREIFAGPIIAGGAVSNGAGVRAMQCLGADVASMGTHFISAQESLASNDYKEMLVASNIEDIATSALFTGVDANYLVPSVENAGLSRDDLNKRRDQVMIDDENARSKAWKDIWSAGQGVGEARAIAPVSEIVNRIEHEYNNVPACHNTVAVES